MKCLFKNIFVILFALMTTGCVLLTEPENRPPMPSPLATWDISFIKNGFRAGAGIGGVLDVSGKCVTLINESPTVHLLVWPEPTSWDATNQTIEFVDPWTEERVTLKHGDRISGGGISISDDFYVQRPDPSCNVRQTFALLEATLIED